MKRAAKTAATVAYASRGGERQGTINLINGQCCVLLLRLRSTRLM